MEWYDLFRLPLCLFWIAPALLLLGFAVFVLLTPMAVLASVALRVGEILRRRLRSGRRNPSLASG